MNSYFRITQKSTNEMLVFKVNRDGVFNIERWDCKPIELKVAQIIVERGFMPVAGGGGYNFKWNGKKVSDGVKTLERMQLMRLD